MRDRIPPAVLDFATMLRASFVSACRSVEARWARVTAEERDRLGYHGITILAAAAATFLTLPWGFLALGPLLVADVVIAAAAWHGGRASGTVAALTVVLAARLGAEPLAGVAFGLGPAILACAKGLAVAQVFAALSEHSREHQDRGHTLARHIQRLQSDARTRQQELKTLEQASSATQCALRDEADMARRQLTTLQSVTDPSLNSLAGGELVSSLLDRVRAALDADGVAVCHVIGVRGRVFSASSGLQPIQDGTRVPSDLRGHHTGRTTLIHNDAPRVVNTSLCRWPDEVTSLMAVPVVHGGRLQLVVEVANRRARRSTEWELALIQVVAERAAGLLRQDIYTNAVA